VLARLSGMVDLVRLAPRALRDPCSSDSLQALSLEEDFPRELLIETRRGLIAGPWLCPCGRVQRWRVDRRGCG
jgi:hypothetical protein